MTMKKKTSKIKKIKKTIKVKKAVKIKKAKKMPKAEIKHYKVLLIEAKKNKLDELAKNLDDGNKIDFNEVKDSVDLASDTYDTEFLHNLSDAEKRTLEEIDYAIAKTEDGTYGSCENCGNLISKQRLEAIPATKHCISCASKNNL